ncbi:MAG: hypothetical protein HRT47_06505 [Candidatus Caenarcaniphilales bacterium]|nr:hypothetical protein [Candidatus Caenarcaniphilales bacterium]
MKVNLKDLGEAWEKKINNQAETKPIETELIVLLPKPERTSKPKPVTRTELQKAAIAPDLKTTKSKAVDSETENTQKLNLEVLPHSIEIEKSGKSLSSIKTIDLMLKLNGEEADLILDPKFILRHMDTYENLHAAGHISSQNPRNTVQPYNSDLPVMKVSDSSLYYGSNDIFGELENIGGTTHSPNPSYKEKTVPIKLVLQQVGDRSTWLIRKNQDYSYPVINEKDPLYKKINESINFNKSKKSDKLENLFLIGMINSNLEDTLNNAQEILQELNKEITPYLLEQWTGSRKYNFADINESGATLQKLSSSDISSKLLDLKMETKILKFNGSNSFDAEINLYKKNKTDEYDDEDSQKYLNKIPVKFSIGKTGTWEVKLS